MESCYLGFVLSKLLKEKGYDHPSKSYYEHALVESYNEADGYNGPFGWRKGETNLQKGYIVNNSHGDNSSDAWYMCSAPTIAEVVMWLYEKHGIWIYADFGLGWEGFTIPVGYSGKATTKELHYNGMNFNSPAQAYESAIEYTLNELI